ncbi:MAG TPA: hypothetical protein PKE03_05315 [Bacteroidales bacterium]|nr:hypothetical protein [Bacteroidales bacterium]
MKQLRVNKLLSVLLAAMIFAGYAGIGFSEHICYSHNERIVSLSLEPGACNHVNDDACCDDLKTDICSSSLSCCSLPTDSSSSQAVIDVVCCLDKFRYHNMGDELVHFVPSVNMVPNAPVILLSVQFDCDKQEFFDELKWIGYKDPPILCRQRLVLLQQLRLDPDLA